MRSIISAVLAISVAACATSEADLVGSPNYCDTSALRLEELEAKALGKEAYTLSQQSAGSFLREGSSAQKGNQLGVAVSQRQLARMKLKMIEIRKARAEVPC